MKGLRKALRRYLVAGVLVLAPLVITIYILVSGFAILDRLFADAVEFVAGRRIPGAGAALTLVVTILTGMFAANVVGRTVIEAWDGLFERIPVVRTVYSSVKQLMQAFGPQGRSGFQRVVLVEHPRKGVWSLGFVTNRAEGPIDLAVGERAVLVFIPTAPNPTTGFLIAVPEIEVVPVDLSVEAAFKLIVSGGIVAPQPAAARTEPGSDHREVVEVPGKDGE